MNNLPATNAGKGDWPRPVNKNKYGQNYDRIFGKQCSYCKGKGIYLDWSKLQKKYISTMCLFCGGTGKEKI